MNFAKLNRRQVIAPILAAAASSAMGQMVSDKKPIKIIVITAPGGSADATARLLAEKLQTRLNRTVIVENKTGAGGNLASSFVAKAPPDGTTLLLTSNNHNVNPYLFREAGYTAKDFVAVSQIVRGPCVLVVNPKMPITTVKEYVEYAKAKPRSMFYATYGTGGAAHLAGEMFKHATGADIEHVPYKGAGPALTEVIGGSVPSGILSLYSASGHIKSGRLRALAVFSEHRWPGAPEIPTVAESGYKEAVYDIWLGLFAPRGTSADWVKRMNREVRVIVSEPETAEKIKQQGMAPTGETAEQFEAFLRTEAVGVAKIVTAAGIVPQ
jgi:tripartite-type tricarboxylate transporter receptor subunit TctC